MTQKIKIIISDVLLTCASLAVSVPLATSLCDSTVESLRDDVFVNYLTVITPEIFLFAFLFFAFDAVFSIFRSHNNLERASFLSVAKKEVTFWHELPRVILSIEFLLEAVMFCAVCLYSSRFGMLHFALICIIDAMRKSAIHRKWYIIRKKTATKSIFRSILSDFASLFFQIFLLIFLLPMALPFLWMFITEYEFFANIILLAFIVIAPIIYSRAVKKRNDFIKNLRALCKEKGFELSKIKNKYSFIFGRQSGANFTVKAYGKAYVCKFIGAKMPNIPMTLKEDGEGNRIYQFSIRGFKLLNKRSYFEYGFEAEENTRKILICSPLPIKMSIEENGRLTDIVSGASIWEYKLFGASNFLRCLEYDVLEK